MVEEIKEALGHVHDALLELGGQIANVNAQLEKVAQQLHNDIFGLRVALNEFHTDQKARDERLEKSLDEHSRRLAALERKRLPCEAARPTSP